VVFSSGMLIEAPTRRSYINRELGAVLYCMQIIDMAGNNGFCGAMMAADADAKNFSPVGAARS
jgi:hypothetical protein